MYPTPEQQQTVERLKITHGNMELKHYTVELTSAKEGVILLVFGFREYLDCMYIITPDGLTEFNYLDNRA